MHLKYRGDKMEQWKLSVLTGVALVILALLFSYVRKGISIWMALVIILGVVDIIFGLYRKTKM
jgi:uncharacterized membrane protein